MEEIKIWAIDGSEVTEIQRTDQTESEQWLEENLVRKPELLIPGLTLVGRQTQTEGGPLDLLGVDSDGRLVVFELKRGTLSRDAVAQVIDYTSYLDSLSEGALSEHISSQSGAHGIEKIDDFQEWYLNQFEELSSLRPIRMFLVGLGADDTTERMVNFLANNSGLDVSLLTFHGFTHAETTLLARQMRVEGEAGDVSERTVPRSTREERLNSLIERSDREGVKDLFLEIRSLFSSWHGVSERVNQGSLSHWLQNRDESGRLRYYSHVVVYAGEEISGRGTVVVYFYEWSVDRCVSEFQHAIDVGIPIRTFPRNRLDNPLEKPVAGIDFFLTADNWESHKNALARIASAIYESVKAERELELPSKSGL